MIAKATHLSAPALIMMIGTASLSGCGKQRDFGASADTSVPSSLAGAQDSERPTPGDADAGLGSGMSNGENRPSSALNLDTANESAPSPVGGACAIRDCTSSQDNDCDGRPDNTLDNNCTCAVGEVESCDQHIESDGKGICKAGERVCRLGDDRSTSGFGACEGSVGPLASDSCALRDDDSNCDGVPNGGCACLAGDSITCAQLYGSVGSCSNITLQCSNTGQWPFAEACSPASQEVCSNSIDDDCDGQADEPDACDSCSEQCFCDDGTCAELVAIDSALSTVCVLSSAGSVWCWGANQSGQVGVSGFQDQLQPRLIEGLEGVRGIAVGGTFSCALQSDDTVVCWGSNAGGQLGDNGTSDVSFLPVQVLTDSNTPLSGVSKIVAGDQFACGLRSVDGSVFCWGAIVGDGRTGGSAVAVAVRRPGNADLLSVGELEAEGSAAIARTGAAWVSWGTSRGALGQGDALTSPLANPVLSQPNPSFTIVGAGPNNACAVTAVGEGYCWGNDVILAGLGSGAVGSPVRFQTLDGSRSFAIASRVGFAVDSNGIVRAFGDAGDDLTGGAGDVVTGDALSPTAVPGLDAVKTVATGANFACAVLLDDTVRCWGINNRGQIGNGTVTRAVTPSPALPSRQ